jgi:hypothetical protein
MFKIQALAGPLLAALAIGALAQSLPPVGKTREQVKAELAEAQRTGDIVWGETGQKLNEIYPDRYPKKVTQPSETRAEVKAELAQAIKDGDLPMGDLDQTDRELMPNRYPPQPMPPGRSATAAGRSRKKLRRATRARRPSHPSCSCVDTRKPRHRRLRLRRRPSDARVTNAWPRSKRSGLLMTRST